MLATGLTKPRDRSHGVPAEPQQLLLAPLRLAALALPAMQAQDSRLQLPDPLPSTQRVSRDDRFVELSATGGDAGLGLGLGDQRGDVGQYLGGQEGPGLLGLGGYFCLGGDLLDLPPGYPGLAIAQHHPHPGALGREETEIGRSHERSFREERKEERKTAGAAAHLGAGPAATA